MNKRSISKNNDALVNYVSNNSYNTHLLKYNYTENIDNLVCTDIAPVNLSVCVCVV